MDSYIAIGDDLPIIDSDCELYPTVLYYDSDSNKMMDCNGNIVFDIFRHITPNQLYLFRELCEDMVIVGNFGQHIELIYPDSHEGERQKRKDGVFDGFIL